MEHFHHPQKKPSVHEQPLPSSPLLPALLVTNTLSLFIDVPVPDISHTRHHPTLPQRLVPSTEHGAPRCAPGWMCQRGVPFCSRWHPAAWAPSAWPRPSWCPGWWPFHFFRLAAVKDALDIDAQISVWTGHVYSCVWDFQLITLDLDLCHFQGLCSECTFPHGSAGRPPRQCAFDRKSVGALALRLPRPGTVLEGSACCPRASRPAVFVPGACLDPSSLSSVKIVCVAVRFAFPQLARLTGFLEEAGFSCSVPG